MQSMNRFRNRNNRLSQLESRLDVIAQQDCSEPLTIEEFVRQLDRFRTHFAPKFRSSIQVILLADYMSHHAEKLIAEIETHVRIPQSQFVRMENEWHQLIDLLWGAILTQRQAWSEHGYTFTDDDKAILPTDAQRLYVARRRADDELLVAVATQTIRAGIVAATACLTDYPFSTVRTTQESEPAAIEVAMQQLADVTEEMAIALLEPVDQ